MTGNQEHQNINMSLVRIETRLEHVCERLDVIDTRIKAREDEIKVVEALARTNADRLTAIEAIGRANRWWIALAGVGATVAGTLLAGFIGG